MAQKKEKNIKVQDLAPKKDAKGGALRQSGQSQSGQNQSGQNLSGQQASRQNLSGNRQN